MKHIITLFALILTAYISVFSQSAERKLFREIVLKADTSQFTFSKDTVTYEGQKYLSFSFGKEDEICELNLYPAQVDQIKSLHMADASDFIMLDSLVLINKEYYRVKIQFMNLFKSRFLNFTFTAELNGGSSPVTEEIKLLPWTRTTASLNTSTDELFIGEEKTFEILTNNRNNIRLTREWTNGEDINYRLSDENGKLMVHLSPNSLGLKDVRIKLQTIIPALVNKRVSYDIPPITQSFKVKASRLSFLNLDKQDVTFDEKVNMTGVEVQMDNARQLIIGKTYRIENQEQPGGALIAELFTKSNLTNDKVLCILRPYNLHRKSEGYLYIKDGDEARYITNCDITPKTTVANVMVMHEGEDWTSNLNVYPGETVGVKIEGVGLHKARFHWEDVLDITSDTMIRSENQCIFKLKVPVNITKRKVALYNQGAATGINLNVREYQLPHTLDFVTLNYGRGTKGVSTLPPTIISRRTIDDITLGYDNQKIDSNDKLFGKQYFDVDIKLIGRRGELIEMKSIKNLLVCPGDNSVRYAYYKDKAAMSAPISLNSQLGNKTYNLEDFSKVQMEIRHQADKYGDPGYEKKIEIDLQRPVIFDIDVSFPAGLLIQNLGKTKDEKNAEKTYNDAIAQYNSAFAAYTEAIKKWDPNNGQQPTFSQTRPVEPQKAAFTDNLGGISLALIAQFSFPDAEKVGKLKPYRVGAGFLAINTFNFSSNAKRDLAAVAIASLYPIKPGKIFNLPIHFGFGYKFQDGIPFIMLSPGIGIRF